MDIAVKEAKHLRASNSNFERYVEEYVREEAEERTNDHHIIQMRNLPYVSWCCYKDSRAVPVVQFSTKIFKFFLNPIGPRIFLRAWGPVGGWKDPPCKMLFYAINHSFFMLNRNSIWFQLSLEVYNVSVGQNPKFLYFYRFLTLKNSKFQILS